MSISFFHKSGVDLRNGIALSHPALLTSTSTLPGLLLERLDSCLHRIEVADVHCMRVRFFARTRNCIRSHFRGCRIQVEDADHAAFVGETPGDRLADTAAAARNDCGFSLESLHVNLLGIAGPFRTRTVRCMIGRESDMDSNKC
jgi:hypothetical protein